MRRRKRLWLFLLVIAGAGAFVIWRVVLEGRAAGKPLVASGSLEAREVDVAALVTGRVITVLREEGDAVGAGEVVGRLDAGEVEAADTAARAAVEAARARGRAAYAAYRGAEDAFKRAEGVLPGGGITAAEYERIKAFRDGAAAELAAARAAAAQAEAILRQNDVRRREVEITAPCGGVVLSRNVETGEVLPAGVPLVTIADLRVLELNVFVPETRLGLVHVGDPVEVEVDSFPHKKFKGVVRAIGTRAEFTPRNVESKEDRVTLVFKVTIDVPNDAGALKPGMPADATFVKSRVAP